MIKFVPLKCKIKKLRIKTSTKIFFLIGRSDTTYKVSILPLQSTLGVAPTIRLDGAYLIINSGVKKW